MISHFLQKLLIEIATIPPSSSAGSEETGREQCYRQYPSVSFLLSLTGIHTALRPEQAQSWLPQRIIQGTLEVKLGRKVSKGRVSKEV